MKTIAQAEIDSGIPASLIRSVIRKLGDRSYLEDVNNHGADAGFPGFIYYSDTEKFFKAHQSDIVMLVNNMASDLGESPAEMVANFNCLKIAHDDAEGLRNVYACLSGGKTTDDSTVENALAWFALEEVARAMCDE